MRITFGGQAVLEGVMMRSPSSWAVAVRTPEGEITEVVREIESPMQRRRIWRLPVVRGVVALGESLAIGFKALAISANVASQERDEHGEVQQERRRPHPVTAHGKWIPIVQHLARQCRQNSADHLRCALQLLQKSSARHITLFELCRSVPHISRPSQNGSDEMLEIARYMERQGPRTVGDRRWLLPELCLRLVGSKLPRHRL